MDKIEIIFKKQKRTIKVGDIFNYYTILSLYKSTGVSSKDKKIRCTCQCKCGKIKEKILLRSLLSNNTKSCGCYNSMLTKQRNEKHGKSKNRLYKTWLEMRRRCNNPNRKESKNYYSKGISICNEWNDFLLFEDWALNNGYKENLTIERIDYNGNYTPENCTWIKKEEQSKNRSSNHYITFNGKTQTLSDWSRELGIKRTTLTARLRRGWPIEKALK